MNPKPSKQEEKNQLLDWLSRLAKGFVIGIGGILPGISGGVLAVIFGLYEAIIDFLADFRHDFGKKLKFLLPVIIGGLLGVLAFSSLVSQALSRFQAQSICLFLGFVLGSFPSLYKEAGKEGRSMADFALFAIGSLVFTVLMSLFGGRSWTRLEGNFLNWFFCGALVGLGVVVPGLSPSNFLLYFGLYEEMAAGIVALDWSVIIPLALGLGTCVLLSVRLVKRLYERHYSKVYHFILASVLGSTFAVLNTEVLPVWKGQLALGTGPFLLSLLSSLALLVLGTVGTYYFNKENEWRAETEN